MVSGEILRSGKNKENPLVSDLALSAPVSVIANKIQEKADIKSRKEAGHQGSHL
jgi:hypothetical protein